MRERPRAPWLLVGLGLGGFVDGILLHQVLQWHHLVSDREPPGSLLGLERNTLADGLFHVATWVLVLVGVLGVAASWRSGRPAPEPRVVTGLLLAGWGAFNLVEGIVDHHLLELHHVRDDLGGPLGWDLAFLAFGATLLVVGLRLQRPDVD